MFGESLYPKDRFWFLIRPGQWMGKWDMRESMKNTYLDQCVVRWMKVITGISWNISAIMPIHLVNDQNDVVNFNTFKTYSLWDVTFDMFKKNIKPQHIWKLWWRIKDWKVIVPTSWSYFIHYYTEFLHWTWRNTSNIERVSTALFWYNKTWGFLWQIAESVNRSCTWKETISGTTIQDFTAWEQIQICSIHTNWWKESLCIGTIILMKLS